METAGMYVAEFEMTLAAQPGIGFGYVPSEWVGGVPITLTIAGPSGASRRTLERRARYGGRKGRAAMRRLDRMGYDANGEWRLVGVDLGVGEDRTVTLARPVKAGGRR